MPHPDPPKRDLYEHTHGRKVCPALFGRTGTKCGWLSSSDVWVLGMK